MELLIFSILGNVKTSVPFLVSKSEINEAIKSDANVFSINVGGKKMSVYNFAKKDNPKVSPKYLKKNDKFPMESSMNIKKLKKIIKVKSLL